jgi:hypothetical protein
MEIGSMKQKFNCNLASPGLVAGSGEEQMTAVL